MKVTFDKETLVRAREAEQPVFCVCHRALGRTPRYDQELTISGPADAEASELVQAVLLYLIDRDTRRLERLKKVVADL